MSILFVTPCYGGMMHLQHHQSAMNLQEDLRRVGLEADWLHGRNESLIQRARCEMTSSFLRSDFTHMMSIDSDIESQVEDVAKLWNLQADVAVAAYAMKLPSMPLSAWKNGKLVKLEECPSEPFEVDFAGTGFMLISRKCIEGVRDYLADRERKCKAMVERICGGAYDNGEPLLQDDEQKLLRSMLDGVAASYEGPDGRVPALFMTPVHNDGLESEDYHFCRIAREAGFKIIMDPSIRLKHWGQYAYGAA